MRSGRIQLKLAVQSSIEPGPWNPLLPGPFYFPSMTYSEKLKDPRWQKKRLQILDRDEWTCQWCGDKHSTLHVHHTYYEKGDPWNTDENLLITVCEDCHSLEHRLTTLESLLWECLRNTYLKDGQFEFIAMAKRCIKNVLDGNI